MNKEVKEKIQVLKSKIVVGHFKINEDNNHTTEKNIVYDKFKKELVDIFICAGATKGTAEMAFDIIQNLKVLEFEYITISQFSEIERQILNLINIFLEFSRD